MDMENNMMDPAMGNDAMMGGADDNKPLMEEEKKNGLVPDIGIPKFGWGDASEESEEEEEKVPPHYEQMCCFVCICGNERTKDITCCGCFPLRCGIVTLGCFYFALTCIIVSWYFFMMLNENIDWWFPTIALLLTAPQIVGTSFWVYYFTQDKRSTRGKLNIACMFAIISLALVAAWNVWYFVWLYHRDPEFVYQGMNEGPYKKTPKKVYIFSILAEAAVLIAFFSYAMCVCERYYAVMPNDKKKK